MYIYIYIYISVTSASAERYSYDSFCKAPLSNLRGKGRYNNNKVYFRQDVHICIHKCTANSRSFVTWSKHWRGPKHPGRTTRQCLAEHVVGRTIRDLYEGPRERSVQITNGLANRRAALRPRKYKPLFAEQDSSNHRTGIYAHV